MGLKIKRTCRICGDPMKFQQKNKAWCGYENMPGLFNVFGYCEKKNVKSKELLAFIKRVLSA